jgi:hypothetical protein
MDFGDYYFPLRKETVPDFLKKSNWPWQGLMA